MRPACYPTGTGLVDRLRRGSEPWIALIPGLTWRSAILDIGCGEGARLEKLAEFGFANLTGADPFMPENRAGISPSGIRLTRRELPEVEGAFDLIMMHHSLEHVADPGCMLREARAKLTRGGRILVRIPVHQAGIWNRFGANWSQLDAPRHFHLFSVPGFVAFAERQCLACIAQGCDGLGWSLAWSEAYSRDVPMFAADGTPNALPFPPGRAAQFEAEAHALNEAGESDQAFFVLEAA